jgi:hypothetical protein
MSLRNTINENPAIPVIGVLIALAVCGYFVWGMIMAPKAGELGGDWVAWYTIDDGKTVFADKHTPSQPFQKDGKDAVMALMYTCDNDKTRFCGYLLKKGPAPARAGAKNAAAPADAGPAFMATYIKKPGDTEWVPDTSYGKFSAIQRGVACPSGTGEPIMVTPAGMNTALTAKPSDKK